jgi:uncharacterized protein YlxP (DUF503 family)
VAVHEEREEVMPYWPDTLHRDLAQVKDTLFILQNRFRVAVIETAKHPQDWESTEIRLGFMVEDAKQILDCVREMQDVIEDVRRAA